jgi:phosphoadenosine phosphosulfate reductase
MLEQNKLPEELASIVNELSSISVEESLRILSDRFPGKVVFSTSFSAEDQVLSHYIFSQKLPIKVFTLDTGRLFAETYSTWSRTLERYQASIDTFYPEQKLLDEYTREKGPNAFYQSVELRKTCCNIRKVRPLETALKHQQVWITGIRAEHSSDRKLLSVVEWDSSRNLLKFNPLLHYTHDQVMKLIQQWGIPYNPLHDKGFVSIGCAPCTRAVQPGEDFRAGRWWWEDPSNKECGLHVHQKSQSA